MSTFTIHPKNEVQEKALETIFDAFDIQYEKEPNENEYLMSTEANKNDLDRVSNNWKAGKA